MEGGCDGKMNLVILKFGMKEMGILLFILVTAKDSIVGCARVLTSLL